MADEPMIENEIEENDDEDIEDDGEATETGSRRRPRSGNRSQGGHRPPAGSRQQNQRPRRHPRPQSDQSDGGYRRQTRFQARRKVCSFCVDKVKVIDWKDVNTLRRYVNNNGSIRARRKTGTCARHQRQLAVAVKRARHLALSPFTDQHARWSSKQQ